MLLRKATESDFEVFKSLYANSSLHWLYASENKNPTPKQEREAGEILYRLGVEPYMLQEIEDEYQNYSKEQYEADFLKSTNKSLFLIQCDSIVVGYITIFRHEGKIKVFEWAMRYNDFDVIKETVRLLKQKFHGKTLQVNVTNRYAISALERLGFRKAHGVTWEKSL